MSRTGQQTVFVGTFPMPPGTVYAWHTHEDHQVAWAARGVLTVHTERATWVLPPSRALWIPAGLRHETGAGGRATMRSLYIRPGRLKDWTVPTAIAASPLLAELIGYLADGALPPPRRDRAEALLADLLTEVPVTTIDVPMPATTGSASAAAASTVAERLRRAPHDSRSLAQWGREVGASERTLARAFSTTTGMPFGQWRMMLRLQAALPMLAAGDPVSRVAARVGYETPSAFVAAFRRATGVTPAAYFRP